MNFDASNDTLANGIVHNRDSRELNQVLNVKTVDVTITSPPYFDLKDYGHKKQIGYGQGYEQYLQDLKRVFQNVYDCTKDNGTLWVIIDAFRRDNEVVPLPFDFSNTIKGIGWKLQEVIIWAKDRTVPWAHQGQMRSLFEYVLLFSKEEKYNFFIDEVRDFETLKKWWVKYPERYNPKGKTPDGLWHFDIPTQGSWGSGYIKHFCPLPEELIEQILKISTREGDLVLDPFAGSGAVLAKADSMKRKYVGFELNKSYIKMFESYLKKTGKENREQYLSQKSRQLPQQKFTSLIIDLRALKFARVILSKLPQQPSTLVNKVFVVKTNDKLIKRNAISAFKYVFLVGSKADEKKILLHVEGLTSKAPLSKYGIQASFMIEKNIDNFLKCLGEHSMIFTYTVKATHKFRKQIASYKFIETSNDEKILSKIKVELDEKDYE